jgi:hypothetical protein
LSINTPNVSNITTDTIKMSHKRRLIDTLRKLFITLLLRFSFYCHKPLPASNHALPVGHMRPKSYSAAAF